MYRRCRCHHDGDGMVALVLVIMFAVIAIPVLGFSWLFFGDSDEKRVAGFLILLECGNVALCGL